MKFFKLVCVAVTIAAMTGCVTVEGVKSDLKSNDPQVRAMAEKQIRNIALNMQYPFQQRVAFMSLLDNDESRLKLMIEASNHRQCDMLAHTFSKMELNNSQVTASALSCLTGAKCLNTEGDSDEGKMILKKLQDVIGNDQKFLLKLMRDNVTWRNAEAYWVSKFLYEGAVKRLVEVSDNQKIMCMLYSGYKYNKSCCDRFDDPIVEKALSKITDKDLLWRSYTNGFNNIRDVFRKPTALKLGEEYCVAKLCEVPEGDDFNYRVYYPVFEGVQSQGGLVDVVIKGKRNGIVHWAAEKIVDDAAFIEIFKAGKGSRLLATRLGVVKDKDTFTQLLKLTEDKEVKDQIIKQGLKVGWDPSVIVLNEKAYSKSLFDCLFCITEKDTLRVIAEKHSLSLVRYCAMRKCDEKQADAFAKAEAEKCAKKYENLKTVSVNCLSLDMDLADAFFLAKKSFPEESFELEFRDSRWSIAVVGRQIDFARAHYDDNKVYWMNFTPSMVRFWLGGAEKSVAQMAGPVAKKLGVEMGIKQIKAKMYFNHDLLDALCDEKYPPAWQMGREAIMTNGDVVRYFTDERTESLAIVPILCMNDTFRNWWKGVGSDPEYEAKKAVRWAANNLGWILAAPGTLRFVKPISANGF